MDNVTEVVKLKDKNEPMSDPEILAQISLRRRIIPTMLGSLYPNILLGEIEFLSKRLGNVNA